MNKNNIFGVLLLLGSVCFQNCGGKRVAPTDESPIAGDIKIAIDESVQPIMESQIDAFVSIYPKAKFRADYKAQSKVIEDFLNDEVKIAITSRDLSDDERKFLTDAKSSCFVVPAASDAIALIVNAKNKDTLINFEQIRQIFSGKIENWKNIKSNNQSGAINLVFDNANSSTVSEMTKMLGKNELPKNSYALKKNTEVMDYVAQHENALGIIGLSWVIDLGATEKKSLSQKIKILALSHPDSTNQKYYQPLQGNLVDGTYPLARKVYMLSRQSGGLGSGLMTFIGSDKGQRIFLKAGLAPQQLPGRTIHINGNN